MNDRDLCSRSSRPSERNRRPQTNKMLWNTNDTSRDSARTLRDDTQHTQEELSLLKDTDDLCPHSSSRTLAPYPISPEPRMLVINTSPFSTGCRRLLEGMHLLSRASVEGMLKPGFSLILNDDVEANWAVSKTP
ncbi:hypothetical protein TREES_T100019181 [Tupaia chinensis]|uniref:Uncharacterized protein n=1 Tax=Tupaia chinensis TaxID=246437 RepID=L9L932_TUPCH|nr:hypothetical protein TREES_T100019181 [Tupaia chinensis]